MAGPGDFVKVTYHGRERRYLDGSVRHDSETPLRLMWDSRPYVIDVDGEGFVPFEAAANAFGDPRSAENMASYRDSAGNTGFVLDRATEVRRLRTLYDNQIGEEGEVLYAPQVELHDLEGNKITTVLDDPEGGAEAHAVQTQVLGIDELVAQNQRQQRMIETLARQQGIDLNDPNLTVNETNDQPSEEDAEAGNQYVELPHDPDAELPRDD